MRKLRRWKIQTHGVRFRRRFLDGEGQLALGTPLMPQKDAQIDQVLSADVAEAHVAGIRHILTSREQCLARVLG